MSTFILSFQAEILSLNEENVRTRLRRGKEKMKIILGGVKIC